MGIGQFRSPSMGVGQPPIGKLGVESRSGCDCCTETLQGGGGQPSHLVIDPEVLLQFLIDLLGLAIALRVISSGSGELGDIFHHPEIAGVRLPLLQSQSCLPQLGRGRSCLEMPGWETR